MTTALERYLQAATRGLWGRKRLEVREELTAHILERAYRHEVAGIRHEDAVARAMTELGDAKTIRAGMIGVYTMPNLFKVSGVLTILAAGAIAVLGVSRAQITVSDRLPIQGCADVQVKNVELPLGNSTKTMSCSYGGFLSVEDIQKTLEPLGVKFSRDSRSAMRYENATSTKLTLVKWDELVLNFPNWAQVRLVIDKDLSVTYPDGQVLKMSFIGEYVHVGRIIDAMRQAGGDLRIAGWDNPGVRYGGIRFTLGKREKPVLGHRVFPELLSPSLFGQFSELRTQKPMWDDAPNKFEEQSASNGGRVLFRDHKHIIQTTLAEGRVVAVVSLEDGEGIITTPNVKSGLRFYYVPVGAGGIIEYPSRAKTLRFSSQLKDLKPTKKDQAGNVVVLRFTGDLGIGKNVFEVMSADNFSK